MNNDNKKDDHENHQPVGLFADKALPRDSNNYDNLNSSPNSSQAAIDQPKLTDDNQLKPQIGTTQTKIGHRTAPAKVLTVTTPRLIEPLRQKQ